MPFSNEIYTQALEIKRKQKAEAESRYEAAEAGAEHDCPRLAEIKHRLAMCGSSIAVSALAGDTNKLAELRAECDRLATEQQELREKYRLPDGPVYSCPECRDTGYRDGRICECTVRLAKNICIDELNAKMPIEESRFDNFKLDYYPGDASDPKSPRGIAADTLKCCKRFAERFPSGENLMFSGAPGLGKTHLSLAVAQAVIEKGYSAIYSPAQAIVDALANERFSYGNSEDVITAMNGCDLLIIDDLGTEVSTSVSVSIIYNLINTRILERKSTVINTNLNQNELRQRYETRVLSRIIGHYTKRVFLGDDIRLQKTRNG